MTAQHLDVLPHLRIRMQAAACVIEIDLLFFVEAAIIGCAQGVENGGGLVVGILLQERVERGAHFFIMDVFLSLKPRVRTRKMKSHPAELKEVSSVERQAHQRARGDHSVPRSSSMDSPAGGVGRRSDISAGRRNSGSGESACA